ncbi:MAG TPA: response regulator transcription factor [Bryobacteraceae bacterium]|nr:response regulator transcription factor [Bryobacteraceae bacterium]
MEKARVLLVDDHPVVRDGLKAMLSVEPDIEIVGEASSGSQGVELCFQLRPDVVLMDLLLPDKNGTDAIHEICGRIHNTSIIVLTAVAGDEEIYRALEAGARGYLLKDMARLELVQAIRTVRSGRRYLPPTVGSRLAESFPRPGLTAREIEVLGLVATGQKNKEIAYELDISEATVNAHVKRVLQKLQAADRTQAVTTALRRGIIRL